MAMVMITCPVTKGRVFTGIETDPASVALVPPINTRLTCPACGNVHTWSMLDAELAGELVERPAPAAPELELRIRKLRESVPARGGERPLRRSLPRAS